MFYSILRVLGLISGYPIQWLFFKKKVYYEGKKNKNWKKGGKLIISNHFNILDYVMTCFMVFPRKLTAVASELPFQSKALRFGMKFFGAIEANRITKDMSFIEKSAEVIYKGGLVQIFPEGRNSPDGEMHDFKPSYVLIADMAGCKIQPIISDGNYGLFKRVHVIVGEEFCLSDILETTSEVLTKEEVERANQIIYKKAQDLRARLEELKNGKKKKK